MNHTYLRYECADSFGLIAASGSSKAPASNAITSCTTTTTTLSSTTPFQPQSDVLLPLVWVTTGSSVTAYHGRTNQPMIRCAHREQLTGGAGTGRALNSSECVCLDTLVWESSAVAEAAASSAVRIRVATGWVDGSIRIFDVTEDDLQRAAHPSVSSSSTFTAHSLGLSNSILQNSSDYATGSDAESSDRINSFAQREPLVLNGHSSAVRTIRFETTKVATSAQQRRQFRLASGGNDGGVVIWDIVEETGLYRLVGHKGPITDLQFVSFTEGSLLDGLLSSCSDGIVKLWDLNLQCCIQSLVNHPGAVHSMDCRDLSLSFRSSSSFATQDHLNRQLTRFRIATGSVDGQVRVWSIEPPTSPNNRNQSNSTIAVSSDDEDAAGRLLPHQLNDPIEHPNTERRIDHDRKGDSDMVCRFRGTVVPPPNAATSHQYLKILCVRWTDRFLGVLRADSKHVDVYRVKSTDESHKTRQRRLRRRKEKQQKRRQQNDDTAAGIAARKGPKRGILDDPDPSDDEEMNNGNDHSNELNSIDPERLRATDELEFLTTVVASHKLKSFSFLPSWTNCRADLSKAIVQLVCILATNALEAYALIRSKDSTSAIPLVVSEKLPILDMSGHPTGIRAVALSSDDALACTVSKNMTKIWNVRTRQCIHSISTSSSSTPSAILKIKAPPSLYGLCVTFIPGNAHVVVGTREGHLLILDINAGEIVFCHEKAHSAAIWNVDLTRSHDSSVISVVTGSADHTVKFWSLESESDDDEEEDEDSGLTADRPILVHTRTLELKDDVVAVRYSHAIDISKRLVFVSTLDNTIKVFFDDSLKLFLNLYGHTLPALAVDSSDDDTLLASGGADKTVKIWGLDFGDTHRTLHGHEDSITDIGFVRRTHFFFTSSKDGTVRYWDGDRFEPILILHGHSAEVNCLALSRTGAFVLSGGMDRQIRVWERTKDIVFLDEERERAMEQIFDKVNGRDGNGTASILDRKDDESDDEIGDNVTQPQSDVAVQRSVLSVAAGDRILEGIERADQELKDIMIWKKANGPGKAKQPNPLLLGLEPAHYILWLLKTIKSAELEQSLLVLPLPHIERLVYYCTVLLRQGRGVELCAKVSVFVVKVHQNQLAFRKSIIPPLRELRRLVRLRLSESRDMVGYNLAALKLAARIAQERKLSQSSAFAEPSSVDIWAGLGLGSDVAAALEGTPKARKRR